MDSPTSHNVRNTAAVVAAGLAFAFASATHLVSVHTAQVISNHLMTLLPLAAGVTSLLVARKRSGRERLAWTLLGAWGLLSATGNGIWEYYEFVLHVEVPFPSLADAGYLGGNLCAVAAVVTFSLSKRTPRIRSVLDATLVTGSLFITSWFFVLDPMYHGSKDGFFSMAVGLAYPVIDVIIVTLIVLAASKSTSESRSPLFAIGLGLLGWAFSDTSFAILTMRGTYHSGHPIDAGWIAGDALIGLVALRSLRSESSSAPGEASSSGWRTYLPYGVVAVALSTGVADFIVDHGRDIVALVGIMVVLVVVVARQFLQLIEGQRITIERLRSVDDMKNGILNAVSHDLRTPLTYIKGTAYLLQDGDLPKEAEQDLIGHLVAGCDRLEETLTGLLDLGRLARGVLEPARRPTDVTDLLQTVAGSVQTEDHPIRVNQKTVMANVDPSQVERIVENLFTNAVRHTPPAPRCRPKSRARPKAC